MPENTTPAAASAVAIVVVELEAMTVALVHHRLAVRLGGARPGSELARIHAEPHGAALLLDVALLGEQVDDRMRREGVELRRVRVRSVENLAGDIDDGALHSEAQPEVRDQLLPRVSRGEHLALDAAMTEAAGHDDAVDALERAHVLVEVLAVDPDQIEVRAAVDRGVAQGLRSR